MKNIIKSFLFNFR